MPWPPSPPTRSEPGKTRRSHPPRDPRTGVTLTHVSKVFTMPVARVYPLYVAKVERKGRSAAEVDEVIR